MVQYALPVIFAIFVWWISTGLILLLNNLPRTTFRWSLSGATLLFPAAAYGLWWSAWHAHTPLGAYLAFSCSLLLWAWQETTYYMGLITGPRQQACPPECHGWRRFRLAIQTSLYHEIAVVLTAMLVIFLTHGAPNQTGTWTFMVLWIMRWSAKLNLFLGVANLHEDWLPEPLRFLKTYLGKHSINLLFPCSVTMATVIVVLLTQAALRSGVPGEMVGLLLVATLLSLAILEHWFLVLPLPDAALWHWAMGAKGTYTHPAEMSTTTSRAGMVGETGAVGKGTGSRLSR